MIPSQVPIVEMPLEQQKAKVLRVRSLEKKHTEKRDMLPVLW